MSRLVLLLSVLLAQSAFSQNPDADDCAKNFTEQCLKRRVIEKINQLSAETTYELVPGVSIVRSFNDTSPKSAVWLTLTQVLDTMPGHKLDAYLLQKIFSYLSTHSVQFSLWGRDNGPEIARRRGGGKRRGGWGALLAMGAMMKGGLMALALSMLAGIAGKALMAGLTSLVISSLVGLKSATGGHKSTTYEVHAKPIYTHENSHTSSHDGHEGYRRDFNVPGSSYLPQ